MTVRINFLPKSYQPPKQMGAKEWGIAAGAAAVVVATGAFYAGMYSSTANMEGQVHVSEAKLATLKAQLADAADIRAREEKVTKAEMDLKSLMGRHWSGVLLNLRQLTPQHVTWSNLKVEGDDITLKGTSRGLIDVAQLLGGLVTDTSIDQVTIKYINEKGVPVTMTVKPGDKDAAKNAGKTNVPDTSVLGTYTQLEFEMVITLVPTEGRKSYGTGT